MIARLTDVSLINVSGSGRSLPALQRQPSLALWRRQRQIATTIVTTCLHQTHR